MMVGDMFYVGLSARTNAEGIAQFAAILHRYGFACEQVPLEKVLHLKTGVNYLENGNLLVSGRFTDKPCFQGYHRVQIPEAEAYAAQLHLGQRHGDRAGGYPAVKAAVEGRGLSRADGGYVRVSQDRRRPELPEPALLSARRARHAA